MVQINKALTQQLKARFNPYQQPGDSRALLFILEILYLITSKIIMMETGSFEKSYATALKVVEFLGLPEKSIRNKSKASLYITYSHNGKVYELRISDHFANPERTAAKKMIFDYTPVELTDNWEIAKKAIEREVFGKKEIVADGSKVNHPKYGEGTTVAHDVDKDKLDIVFNGEQKSFHATVIIDRGWIVPEA